MEQAYLPSYCTGTSHTWVPYRQSWSAAYCLSFSKSPSWASCAHAATAQRGAVTWEMLWVGLLKFACRFMVCFVACFFSNNGHKGSLPMRTRNRQCSGTRQDQTQLVFGRGFLFPLPGKLRWTSTPSTHFSSFNHLPSHRPYSQFIDHSSQNFSNNSLQQQLRSYYYGN